MIKNFIITSFRNLSRNRTYSLLNIFGLALGIGCALVIYKIITYELSFDQHQSNYSQLYRLVREKTISTGISHNEGVPHPMGKAMRSDFPDIKSALIHDNSGTTFSVDRKDGTVVRFQEEEGIAFMEKEMMEILDFRLVAGMKTQALEEPKSVILSQSMAQKYFGFERDEIANAIGKTMMFENKIDLKVTAIMEDPPEKTDFPFKALITYESQAEVNRYFGKGDNWRNNSGSTNCMIRVPSNISINQLEARFPDFIDKYYGPNSFGELHSQSEKYKLQPLSDIHFNTEYSNYSNHQVSEEMLVSLAIIGLFLLVTAAINFINLSTAQAVKRSKEVGIRKTLGGSKSQLVIQFLSETLIITIIAAFISLVIAELLLTHLKDIIGYELHLNLIAEPMTLVFMSILIVVVGLLAGLYPSFTMSKMNPVVALKSKLMGNTSGRFLSFRRILVILQFSISQILIIATLVVISQMDYFLSKDLGFNTEAIVNVSLPENEKSTLDVLKANLLQHSDIEEVSFALAAPLGNSNSYSNISHKSLNKEEEYRANFKIIDEDYLSLFNLKLIAGRNIKKSDSSNLVLISRNVSKLIGFNDPNNAIGEKIDGWGGGNIVIGVVENFHIRSLMYDQGYVIMLKNNRIFYNASIKLNNSNKSVSDIQNQVDIIEREWSLIYPDNIFDFSFYTENLAERYEEEKRISQLFQLFSFIAIFIGCLGLYGLISYMSNQKTKEIGIRKVLGATMLNILSIFSVEIVVLIIFSFAIAGPVGFFAMSAWLDNYAYSINLTPFVFVISLITSLFIAITTIAYKSISASLANPVLSLKDE